MKKILSLCIALAIALGLFTVSFGAVTAVSFDGYVTGRGLASELVDAENPYVKDNWRIITFAGFAAKLSGGDIIGKWLVNLNNVGNNVLDNSRFRTTEITELNFFPPDSATCTGAMNFTALGEFNGTPDYKMIFRAGDDDDTLEVARRCLAGAPRSSVWCLISVLPKL